MIDRLVKNQAPSLLDTDKANEIIDTINGLLSSRGVGGIIVKEDGNGSLLIAPEGTKGLSVKYKPFEVISVSEDTVVVNVGLVNGVLPSSLSVSNGTGQSYICLDITGDVDGISSVDLTRETSPPDGIPFEENGINTNFKYVIAIVSETQVESQIVDTHLFFSADIVTEIPKETVAVGEYPNNIYYTWKQTI